MVDAAISRARLRDLAGLGRSRPAPPGGAGPRRPSASRRRTGADASSIAAGTSPRPRAASSRPGSDDLVASTIRVRKAGAACGVLLAFALAAFGSADAIAATTPIAYSD